MERHNIPDAIKSGAKTTDSPTGFSLAGYAMVIVAVLALFPYGFFIAQAYRRTIDWPKAILNTCLLLLIHALAGALILGSYDGYSLLARKAGFVLFSINIILGYDWQVRNMTIRNGYADWKRALNWIGFALKVLAIGTIVLQFKHQE